MSRISNETYTVELTGQELCTLMADACYTEVELAIGQDEAETTEAAKKVRRNAIEKLKEAFFPKATKIWNEERKA